MSLIFPSIGVLHLGDMWILRWGIKRPVLHRPVTVSALFLYFVSSLQRAPYKYLVEYLFPVALAVSALFLLFVPHYCPFPLRAPGCFGLVRVVLFLSDSITFDMHGKINALRWLVPFWAVAHSPIVFLMGQVSELPALSSGYPLRRALNSSRIYGVVVHS